MCYVSTSVELNNMQESYNIIKQNKDGFKLLHNVDFSTFGCKSAC